METKIESSTPHAAAAAPRWQSEQVLTWLEIDVGNAATSLEVDGAGDPHISCSLKRGFGSGVNYVSRQGTGPWTLETVADPADSPFGAVQGVDTSLALDPQGSPHISYTYHGSDELWAVKHAWKDGTWRKESVSSIGTSPTGASLDFANTSIASDPAGVLHVSLYDCSDGWLKYTRKVPGGGWSTPEPIVDLGLGKSYYAVTAIAVDRGGVPHIVYYNPRAGAVEYAKREPDGWHRDTIRILGGKQHCSISVDQRGVPNVAFYDSSRGVLLYAKKEGATWSQDEADHGPGDVGDENSIAVDSRGIPHVSYLMRQGRQLKYARKLRGTWLTEVVPPLDKEVWGFTSIALDAHDEPHITYLCGPFPMKLRYNSGTISALPSVRVVLTLQSVKVVDQLPSPPSSKMSFGIGVGHQWRNFPATGTQRFPSGQTVPLPPQIGVFTLDVPDPGLVMLMLRVKTELPPEKRVHPKTHEVELRERPVEIESQYGWAARYGQGTHVERSSEDAGYFELAYRIDVMEVH